MFTHKTQISAALLAIILFSCSCSNDTITKRDIVGKYIGIAPSYFEMLKYKIMTHVDGFAYRGKLRKQKDYLYFYPDGTYMRKSDNDSVNSGTWEIKDNSELMINIPWNTKKDSSYRAVYNMNDYKLYTIKTPFYKVVFL